MKGDATRFCPILAYHSLDESGSVVSTPPAVFAEQMSHLAAAGLRGIALREAVAWRAREGAWPERSVVLTFDDGYTSFAEAALPILLRHGFRATIFLVSDHVGRANDWAGNPPDLGRRPLLDWSSARALAAAGMELGSHGRTHRDLAHLSAGEVASELRQSRREIEERAGVSVESFAYPFGSAPDRLRDLVRAEYRAACTTVLRRAGDEPLEVLPRIDVYYLQTTARLIRAVTGHLDGYLTLRRWGRGLRGMLPA